MFEDTRVVVEQGVVSPAIAMPRTDEDELELAVREHARLVYRIAYGSQARRKEK
jgi:hypothetical protein